MTRENLVEATEAPAAEVPEDAYPEIWRQDDQQLSLRYRFEPGAEDDGVTVLVPLALLARLRPDGFDWQVPGLREELVTALIKSLPKAIRRNVVPAADWARRLLGMCRRMSPDEPGENQPSLREYLAAEIQRQTYTPVTADDFDLDRVPVHLRVTFAVVDERGRQVAASKDLEALQHKLKTRARASVAHAYVRTPNALERDGLTSWDFDALPPDARHEAGRQHRARLPGAGRPRHLGVDPAHEHARPTNSASIGPGCGGCCCSPRPPPSRTCSSTSPAPKSCLSRRARTARRRSCSRTASSPASTLSSRPATVRTKAQFEHARDRVSQAIMDDLFTSVSLVAAILAESRRAQKAIAAASSMALIAPLADAREQLDALVFPGFVSLTGLTQLRRVPLYLAGITHRVSRLAEHPGRDRAWLTEVQTATAAVPGRRRHSSAGPGCRSAPGAGAVAARRVAPEPVRTAPRHRRIGVPAAHHQGPGCALTAPAPAPQHKTSSVQWGVWTDHPNHPPTGPRCFLTETTSSRPADCIPGSTAARRSPCCAAPGTSARSAGPVRCCSALTSPRSAPTNCSSSSGWGWPTSEPFSVISTRTPGATRRGCSTRPARCSNRQRMPTLLVATTDLDSDGVPWRTVWRAATTERALRSTRTTSTGRGGRSCAPRTCRARTGTTPRRRSRCSETGCRPASSPVSASCTGPGCPPSSPPATRPCPPSSSASRGKSAS